MPLILLLELVSIVHERLVLLRGEKYRLAVGHTDAVRGVLRDYESLLLECHLMRSIVDKLGQIECIEELV